MLSSGIWCRLVVLVRTDHSEEHMASIYRVKHPVSSWFAERMYLVTEGRSASCNGISKVVSMYYRGDTLDEPLLCQMWRLASHRGQQCKVCRFHDSNNEECCFLGYVPPKCSSYKNRKASWKHILWKMVWKLRVWLWALLSGRNLPPEISFGTHFSYRLSKP
jgi:hypothetical protein